MDDNSQQLLYTASPINEESGEVLSAIASIRCIKKAILRPQVIMVATLVKTSLIALPDRLQPAKVYNSQTVKDTDTAQWN
jgi:hypothetical protein